MLQEFHLDDSEHTKLNKMRFKSVYFFHGSEEQRGVVIIILSPMSRTFPHSTKPLSLALCVFRNIHFLPILIAERGEVLYEAFYVQ